MKKKLLPIFYFLVSNHLIFSQQIDWIKPIGYVNPAWGGDSPVLNIETDSAGNLYNAGKISKPYSTGYSIAYHTGFFLEKRDSNGNILWRDTALSKISLGSLNFDHNYLFITGGFSSDSIILGNTIVLYKPTDSINSSFFAKYDLQGNIIWAKQDVHKYKFGKMKYYNKAFYCYGNEWFSKFDMGGNLLWSIKAAKWLVSNVTISDSNNIYIKTGASFEPDSIKKYDSNGNLLWAIDFPAYGLGFTSDKKGNCYISGVFGNPGNYLAKINSNGQLEWMNYNYPHGLWHLYADPELDYVYSGGNDVNNKCWLSIYDTLGNYIRGVEVGDYVIAYEGGKTITRHGQNFYVGGYNTGQYLYGFIAKISDTSLALNNINEEQIENNSSLNVYPNPTGGNFQINYFSPEKGKVQLNITDSKGKTVYTETFQGNYNKAIDLGTKAKGIYFVEITAGEKRTVKKIILE